MERDYLKKDEKGGSRKKINANPGATEKRKNERQQGRGNAIHSKKQKHPGGRGRTARKKTVVKKNKMKTYK